MNSNSTTQPASRALNGSPEQTRLEDAMRRADDLLVSSLKVDERRRNRRKIFMLSLGGLLMLAIVCAVLLSMTVETEKGGQLTQEGWDLWKTQQYDQAIEKFQEAVKLDPKN